MANFFSVEYWKALYFKAMGGQATAVDPNAMSGSFAGSASFTGTLDPPAGFISGTFAGTSTFTGDLTGGAVDAGGADGPDPRKRKKRFVLWDYELKAPKDALVAAREFLNRRKQPPPVKVEEIAPPEPVLAEAVSEADDEDEIIMLLLAA
jgi:hypothetical protein